MAERILALRRLWRPRHPLFRCMIALQLVSSLFMGVLVHGAPLPWVGAVLRVLVAINSVLGMYLAWRLMRRD